MSNIDKNKVRAAFDRAASNYDAMADFQHRVCERLLKLLPMAPAPARIIDGGCGTGYGSELLHGRWPAAQLIGCDLAPEMVRTTMARGFSATCGDLEQLPFADGDFNLAWSNLALQWCDPARTFSELYRVLAPGGTLACTTLAVGTLCELDAAFAGIDAYRRVLPFGTSQSTNDALRAAGFTDIRIVHETWITRHANFRSLLETIRGIGASQSGHERRRSMMGKHAWQEVQARYEALRGNDSLLPVTYEVMFVFASKT